MAMHQLSMFFDAPAAEEELEPVESVVKRCEMTFDHGLDDLGLIDLVSSRKFYQVEIKSGPALEAFGSPGGLTIVLAGGLSKRPGDFLLGYKGRIIWLSAMEWLEVISSGEDAVKLRISKTFLYTLSTLDRVKGIFAGRIRLSSRVKILAFGIDPCPCSHWRGYLETMRKTETDTYRQFLEYARIAVEGICDGAPADLVPSWAKKTAQSWALAQLSRRGSIALLPSWYVPSPHGWEQALRERLEEWEERWSELYYEITKRDKNASAR